MGLFHYLEDLGGLELNLQCEPTTDAALAAHIARQTERMRERARQPSESRRKVFIIQDNSHFPSASAAQRQMLAQWIREEGALMALTVLGVGFVIDSALVRGALTAVFWLSRLPMPHTVHASLDQAIAHALVQCDAADVQVDPALRERRAALVRERASRLGSRSETPQT